MQADCEWQIRGGRRFSKRPGRSGDAWNSMAALSAAAAAAELSQARTTQASAALSAAPQLRRAVLERVSGCAAGGRRRARWRPARAARLVPSDPGWVPPPSFNANTNPTRALSSATYIHARTPVASGRVRVQPSRHAPRTGSAPSQPAALLSRQARERPARHVGYLQQPRSIACHPPACPPPTYERVRFAGSPSHAGGSPSSPRRAPPARCTRIVPSYCQAMQANLMSSELTRPSDERQSNLTALGRAPAQIHRAAGIPPKSSCTYIRLAKAAAYSIVPCMWNSTILQPTASGCQRNATFE